MNKEEFIKLTKELEIDFTEKQLRELEIYKNFLIEYNNHTNLTAIKDEPGIYLKHFYDSLTLYPYIKENWYRCRISWNGISYYLSRKNFCFTRCK